MVDLTSYSSDQLAAGDRSVQDNPGKPEASIESVDDSGRETNAATSFSLGVTQNLAATSHAAGSDSGASASVTVGFHFEIVGPAGQVPVVVDVDGAIGVAGSSMYTPELEEIFFGVSAQNSYYFKDEIAFDQYDGKQVTSYNIGAVDPSSNSINDHGSSMLFANTVYDVEATINVEAKTDQGDNDGQFTATGIIDINKISIDPNFANVSSYRIIFSPGVSNNHFHSVDGDNHSDILFRRTSDGLAYLFTMNDATVTNGATLSTQVGNNWQIKGFGDFDGNGTSDLLFVYNNASNASDPLNGISYVTLQNGPAATSGSNVVQQLGPEWSVQGTGDFDGDGKSDVLYRRSTDGSLYLDAMNGASIDFSKSGFLSQQISDLHWQVAGIGDFDGDGHADILWRYDNPSNASDPLNGVVYEWLMNGTNVVNQGLISSQPGSDKWQVAGTGDFDGDGTTDILFRYNNTANAGDALNGFTYLDLMNGTNVSSASAPTQWQVDNSWSVASIGDYNGDGKSDILFQHAGDGGTYIWDMNGAATTSGNFTSMQSGPGWAVQNGALIG